MFEMEYVIGIDLGTSAIKTCLMNANGQIVDTATAEYELIHQKPGYSEQKTSDWLAALEKTVKEIVARFKENRSNIVGISYSGQMHGLVVLNNKGEVLRPAILWNDTRTTKQCREIEKLVGEERLISITKNPALEGFTLPKLLWVKENEPELYAQISTVLLPKDYLRFEMTGQQQIEFSDAAGTLLLDIANNKWSEEIAEAVGVDVAMWPPLIESTTKVGTITADFAKKTGLASTTNVFGGAADNACGAIGTGIISDEKAMVSIGTSGVLLAYENDPEKNFNGKVHFMNHAIPSSYYTMGVTLSAGHSLSWFRKTFAEDESFDTLVSKTANIKPGSDGLIYTPYLVGERTPYADSVIRASFIGVDASHTKANFTKAVMEGITFSLRDSLEIFKESGKTINEMISIGGGSINPIWLQMQADIFDATIIKLANDQGPSMGACMIALVGAGLAVSFEEAVEKCVRIEKRYRPSLENVRKYNQVYSIYKEVYGQTKSLNETLQKIR